jgi:hypothetical protein
LLVEIGNLRQYGTFVPNQDKNKIFLNKKLSDITSITEIYKFSYDRLIQNAKTVDVTWFNERNMPAYFFEVEHSTDIYRSLLKFCELQDFHTKYFIVADTVRKRDYEEKVSATAFSPIQNRIKFMSYDQLSEWHERSFQVVNVERGIGL